MFQNPFSFDGRIRRLEYGISFIIYIVAYIIAASLFSAGSAGALIGLIVIVPTVWFLWAQGAKRCHDFGHSGWMQLIPFFVFVMLFSDSHVATNEYGTNPKNPNQVDNLDSETLDGHMGNLNR